MSDFGAAIAGAQGLVGTTETAKTETAKTETAETETAETETAETETAETETAETETAETETAETETAETETVTKPPKGFVPLQALQEARQTIKDLRKALDRPVVPNNSTSETVKSTPETFVRLSVEEEEALMSADPAAYVGYMNEKMEHLKTEIIAAEKAKQEQVLIDKTYADIATAFPGIFEETGVVDTLREQAQKQGFTEEAMYLTDPRTKITTANGDSFVLGPTALHILKMIDGTRSKAQKVTKPRPTVKAVKGSTMRAIPSSATTVPTTKVLSAAEYGKLSPAERERYLSGE